MIDIRLALYFEVKDAKAFGGVGSIGYTSMRAELYQIDYESENIFNTKSLMEEYISSQKNNMAKFCEVPIECIRVISKEEYEENTEEED